MLNSTDVFVIGGGPAGLAAAIAARQQGLSVVVADGAHPPVDKACGEALLPDALAAFERLGLAVPAHEASVIRGVRYLTADVSAETDFPSGSCGLSVRRTTLHRIMSERAAGLGVDLLWNTVVTGISGARIRLGERCIRSRWIVGADGSHSRVRRWADIEANSRSGLRFAFRRHYRVRPWSDRLEVYWGKTSQGFVSPVGEEEICVATASHNSNFRLEESLREFPELHARLRNAEPTSVERGSATSNCRLKRVWRKNVALIGDASGTVDAITGEGLGLALCQAQVLASCLKSSDLAAYQSAHRRLAARPLMMARLMLTLDRRPGMQRRALHVFRQRPEIFRRLVALHVGAISPFDMAVDGLTLGWGLLTA